MSSTADLPDRWRRYFVQGFSTEMSSISEQLSAQDSVYVDLVSVHEFDSDLTQAIFKRPSDVLDVGARVLNELTTTSGTIYLRVENNPHHCTVDDIDADHLYDLVTVEGRVSSVGPVQASLDSAVYECPACEQRSATRATGIEDPEPHYCENCRWTGPFTLVYDQSTFIDLQLTELTPPARENGHGSREPLRAYLTGDIVEDVSPDNEYHLTGILRANRTDGLNAFDPYLSVLNFSNEKAPAATESFKEAIDARFGV